MPSQPLRIEWAPKVRRQLIWRLYASDAQGLLDEELVEQVGFGLWQRCESILLVTEGKRLYCPQCGAIVVCAGERWSRQATPLCAACGWQATCGQYRDSWRKRELTGGNAVGVFKAYFKSYPHCRTRQEKMLAIDGLIHAFHYSLRHHRSHAPAANQLIEGGLEQVMAFLDELTYGPGSTPNLAESQAQWRQTLARVAERFPFVREKLPSTKEKDF